MYLKFYKLASLRVLICIFLMCFTASTPFAVDFKKQSLYAAFILNFARFSKWPEDTVFNHPKELKVCIANENPEGVTSLENQHIAKQLTDKEVGKKKLVTQDITSKEALDSCQILYISGNNKSSISNFLEASANKPILTIGTSNNFSKSYGIIQLFEKKEKIRFSVNTTALHKANIKISSRILKLAIITK